MSTMSKDRVQLTLDSSLAWVGVHNPEAIIYHLVLSSHIFQFVYSSPLLI
jgi:hypothetical protein